MSERKYTIVTSGTGYLDIDAYACIIAINELLRLQGKNSLAFSQAACNYSVCRSLIEDDPINDCLPSDCTEENSEYIIVDVSDPGYLEKSISPERVIAVYDHHTGFENYWRARLGENSHIRFIGAAATLIYGEWKQAGLLSDMSMSTARLLVAAILDNTLNLMSDNTSSEDICAFDELCKVAGIKEDWCAAYFNEVQESIEADLKNAIFGDIKRLEHNSILPSTFGQLAVWDAERVLERLSDIRAWFKGTDNWLMNIIDIGRRCSYFVCDDEDCKADFEKLFDVKFNGGVSRAKRPYLRKEIIKKAASIRMTV